MSDALTPEAEGYLRNCVDMRFGDAADDAELLFAEIDRLRGELEAANNANRLGAECESDLAKRLSGRDRQLAELRDEGQFIAAEREKALTEIANMEAALHAASDFIAINSRGRDLIGLEVTAKDLVQQAIQHRQSPDAALLPPTAKEEPRG